ncbi:MAG: hypothetical protein K0U12_03295 [Gammaproteobacteria bacterium]|nr:hypothetical protein [Gammaproteobacteria bacterium]
MNKKLLTTLIIIAGLGSLTMALASPTGFYGVLGGSVGALDNANTGSYNANLQSNGSYLLKAVNNKLGLIYGPHIGAGYFFNHNPQKRIAFGVEADYDYYLQTKSKKSTNFSVGGTNYSSQYSKTQNLSLIDLEGVVSFDIFNNTSLILKAGPGYAFNNIKETYTLSPTTPGYPYHQTLNDGGIGVAGGVGMQYQINQHIAVRGGVDAFYGQHDTRFAQFTGGLVVNNFNV